MGVLPKLEQGKKLQQIFLKPEEVQGPLLLRNLPTT